jgi:hypothetical protein
MNTDLKLIWIISLLLLLIILLSGVKVCNVPKMLETKFIDRKYNYISEPFVVEPTDLNKILKVNDEYIASNLSKIASENRENKKIKELKDTIDLLEMKMKKLMT